MSENDLRVPVEQARRIQELELDLLVGHELATTSPAARLVWEAVGQNAPVGWVSVVPQATLPSQRPADFAGEAPDGRRLLVEDKINGGHFEDGQVDSYMVAADGTATWAVLIAPVAFIEGNRKAAAPFHARVAVEDLADALDEGRRRVGARRRVQVPGRGLAADHKGQGVGGRFPRGHRPVRRRLP